MGLSIDDAEASGRSKEAAKTGKATVQPIRKQAKVVEINIVLSKKQSK